ncbi:MAG: pyridoxal-phosphate dependent enzyme [Candidatus Obscuribacterales bacterium]|nr:pyridoxal-phosphate dependent enzyme [Candidatus Obscuribacterales bacterium]
MLQSKCNGALRPTLVVESVKLNNELGLNVHIASEAFQHTGSFKFRAAYNVATNSPAPHLVTASSGNFGQALAYACRLTRKKCTVIMPAQSTKAKVDAVRSFGADARLVDVSVKSRGEWLDEVIAELGSSVENVSPYDDPRVIEGNSSLADELYQYKDRFDTVVVPIGGGGLSSGLISGFRRLGLAVDVIGAEPLLGNDAARSFRDGTIIVNNAEPATIADGARTLSVGQHNWEILKNGLSDIIEVSEENIVRGLQLLFFQANMKVEPTGALSLGAVLSDKQRFFGKKPLLIMSGGNVDGESYVKLLMS